MMRAIAIAALVALSGCVVLSPKEKVVRNLAKRGEILAEWIDRDGGTHVLVRRDRALIDYFIRSYPYVEPEMVGRVDLERRRCTSILKTDGSGWTPRPGGRYRYEHATRIHELHSSCAEYRNTAAWPHIVAALALAP